MPITTDNEFRLAVSHAIETGVITGVKPFFVDALNRIVLDEGNSNANVTPDTLTLEQALIGANAQIEADAVIDRLKNLTRSEVAEYLRKSLIAADGNASEISNLYNNARAYEQQNAQLSSTMATFRTLHNIAYPLNTINLSTNQGKATYLLYFINAVGLWS